MIEKVKRPAAITPSVSQEPGRVLKHPNLRRFTMKHKPLRNSTKLLLPYQGSICDPALERRQKLLIPSNGLDGPYPSRVSLMLLERFLRPWPTTPTKGS